MQDKHLSDMEFYVNVLETNYFRANDPIRVPVWSKLTVRELLVKVVDIYGKPKLKLKYLDWKQFHDFSYTTDQLYYHYYILCKVLYLLLLRNQSYKFTVVQKSSIAPAKCTMRGAYVCTCLQ